MKIRLSIKQDNLDEFIGRVIDRYHFSADDREMLMEVYKSLQSCARPCAEYRINRRTTGIAEIDNNQTAIVAMTLGHSPDKLQEAYNQENDLDSSYGLDCIANELLLGMYEEFNKAYARFHRRYVKKYYFVGEDIPVDNSIRILEELRKGGEEAEADEDAVSANAYGVMQPAKSVLFYAVLSENPHVVCEGICNSCMKKCDYRIKDKESKIHESNDAYEDKGTAGEIQD